MCLRAARRITTLFLCTVSALVMQLGGHSSAPLVNATRNRSGTPYIAGRGVLSRGPGVLKNNLVLIAFISSYEDL